MARYLITGIAGFIGSSLAHELVSLGHDVRGVDNLSCGDLRNLDPIRNYIDFREMDINDTDHLRAFCSHVDFVLHQAAIASVPRSINDPIGSHIANVNGTLSVLIAARDAGVSRVVYAASSSAYGDEPTQPKHELMLPGPISPYAVQKLAAEQYVKSFWHVYGLEGICLRYFNVFGPKQSADSPYSGVIARFIADMLSGTVPTIYGTGKQSRDFTPIGNVVAANLLACTAPGRGHLRRDLQHRHRKEPDPERSLRSARRPAPLLLASTAPAHAHRRHRTLPGQYHQGARCSGLRLPSNPSTTASAPRWIGTWTSSANGRSIRSATFSLAPHKQPAPIIPARSRYIRSISTNHKETSSRPKQRTAPSSAAQRRAL